MTDRHRNPGRTLRATPEKWAEWDAAASKQGVPLTRLIVAAIDSHVASLRTATLRHKKATAAAARVTDPCDDPHCSRTQGHYGRCDFLRQP